MSRSEIQVNLTGEVALVTGASSGIGQAIAASLAKAGASVAINYKSNEEGALETADNISRLAPNCPTQIAQADVASQSAVEEMFSTVERSLGPISILINNAGLVGSREAIETMSEEVWDNLHSINLKGTFLCTKRSIPSMKEKKSGRIVNISTSAAHTGGGPGVGHYASSKAGVLALTRNAAKELAEYGITVNCVSPGVVHTPMHEKTPEHVFERLVGNVPLGRIGVPEDVVGPVLFLVSDSAGYITGEVIHVNGGMLMV